MAANRMFQQAFGGLGRGAAPPVDQAVADTAETTYISSLALLKMLKHGRAGVPMEVMGLMLGEFVDEYTISVVDVFAMPQSGTGVSVEAVDPVFQTKMLDMLRQTNRPQMVVGWYHSHPGFGPWLSGVDVNCFPVEDHQILTETGFMYHHEVVEYLKTHPTIGIASYVPGETEKKKNSTVIRGRLVYQPIASKDITYHEGDHRLVSFVSSGNTNVDIQPTDNHNMWVRFGTTAAKGAWSAAGGLDPAVGPDFGFQTAAELVTAGQKDAKSIVRFSAQFELGVSHDAGDGLDLPCSLALGLTTRAMVDAFLWVYGYWLGDGWLDGSARCQYVCFGPVKPQDWAKLDALLPACGLAPLTSATVGVHGFWRAPSPNAKGQRTYRICSSKWWNYFAQQYGHKYAGVNSLAASAEGAAHRGGAKPVPRYDTASSSSSSSGQSSAEKAKEAVSEVGVAAPCCEALCFEVGELVCGTTGKSLPQVVVTSAAVSSAVVSSSGRSSAEAAGSPDPLAAEDIDSAKWFWYWVFKRLGARHLRIILAGLHFADGDAGTSHPVIHTSSVRFRDEIMRVAVQAGYSVSFVRRFAVGQQCGVNAQGVPIIAKSDSWNVHYTSYVREAQPRVSAPGLKTSVRNGAVWCVTVPHPHLIMVRRVIKKEGDKIVAASRPLIVGNTQQSFEQLNKRAVAVVVDPIQSVKGKVVIDAFRTINPQQMMMGLAPRQTTSNLGHLRKPSIAALIHNLNRHYYSINIGYRKNELEQKMLLNLHKKNWTDGLTVKSTVGHAAANEESLKTMLELAKSYNKRLEDAEGKSAEELLQLSVGKMDPKKHIESQVEELMTSNISQTLGLMLTSVIFSDDELKTRQ